MGKTSRSAAAALAMLFLAVGVAQAAGGDAEFELEAVGMIDVGPDGSVHDYVLETDLDPKVADLVDRTVRDWRFEPVLVDGRPVIAVTRMRLKLEALPRDDGYALRVADVAFGEPQSTNRTPPVFPRVGLNMHAEAIVSLLLRLDATGKVAEVHVEQVNLSIDVGKRANFLRATFAANSRKAALDWTFDLGEIVDGEPVPAVVRVPVAFEFDRTGEWSKRPTYHPGPYHPSPWTHRADPGTGMLAQGSVQQLDPRVKLRDDVIGSFL